jgi:predicted CopG family antitoxin
MGRQHTTWISDETWKKLENIKGDSVSEKIRNAIEQTDPDREMLINAEMRRLSRLVQAMKKINALLVRDNADDTLGVCMIIEEILDEVEFCWRD